MSNGTVSAPPTSEPHSSTPIVIPSSTPPKESSQPPPPSSTPPPSTPTPSQQPPISTITAPSAPPSTEQQTQIITVTPTPGATSVITITSVLTGTQIIAPPTSAGVTAAPTSTSTSPASLQNDQGKSKSSGGLGTGGKTAIAVVVPVVVVAVLVLAGIILWRRRKAKQSAAEARRKEVEEYGFNPNHDPTLPAVGIATEMTEDGSGYRGWGNTTTGSNRKASTTLTSGMTYSDSNSNPGGYQSPGSPTQAYPDDRSNGPLVDGRRETLDSEGIGALGNAPNTTNQDRSDIHRGPSNASSSYSAANRSDTSGDYPLPMSNPQDYYDNGYYQPGPYGDNPYGAGQQPVIRDVSARRNTRIENPSVFPHQGNSGIAQNF